MSTITAASRKSGAHTRPAAPSATVETTPDLVRRRAYAIFEARRGGPGDHLSDWLQAERELSGAPRATPGAVR
ncbi:MAG: DUF2934 domain-containing protein [Phycisphaerales bacterium]|nr:DUF2934 domain-containing protein [Phycisphaerales bacterium]